MVIDYCSSVGLAQSTQSAQRRIEKGSHGAKEERRALSRLGDSWQGRLIAQRAQRSGGHREEKLVEKANDGR